MRIFLLVINYALSLLGVLALGLAYFGNDLAAARNAFTLTVITAAITFFYTLFTGEALNRTKSSPRNKVIGDLISRAELVFIVLGAFAGQHWALGWAFWINIVLLGIAVLALTALGGVALANKDSLTTSKPLAADDWRRKV